ncbi:MAG: hypothetical protein HYX21_02580 [Candidatus Yanofskybacteria bacterium]|nr:hypothetical protein [Candidatus Yanofskybacteria bacterium]
MSKLKIGLLIIVVIFLVFLLSPWSLISDYLTVKAVRGMISYLNDYYATNGTYPTHSEFYQRFSEGLNNGLYKYSYIDMVGAADQIDNIILAYPTDGRRFFAIGDPVSELGFVRGYTIRSCGVAGYTQTALQCHYSDRSKK